MKFLLFVSLFSLSLSATSVRKELNCPNCKFESCRWEIDVNKATSQIEITWNKSIVSHHTEKPYASSLHCNVDRSFSTEKPGYIRVWFENEQKPCDVNEHSDPSLCGVTFLFHPDNFKFPRGFKVEPRSGKTLSKVEHLSTLNLQCGDLTKSQGFSTDTWNAIVGWDSKHPGEGTYAYTVN